MRLLCGEYSVYCIYSWGIDANNELLPGLRKFKFTRIERAQIKASNDLSISEQIEYHGNESYAYGYLDGSRIIGLCFFWFNDRYRTRNYWNLADGEAKLVQIVTVSDLRGIGIATSLIAHASLDMQKRGFHCLYARIWHSNNSSIRAFKSAGWIRMATVIELNPFRREIPYRIIHRISS